MYFSDFHEMGQMQLGDISAFCFIIFRMNPVLLVF